MTGLRALERWWFAPSARYQVGVLRVVLVVWLAHHYATRLFPRLGEFAARPREFLDPPSLARVFTLLGLPIPMPPRWVPPIEGVAWILIGLALFGIATRVALIALMLLNSYLGAVAHSWGYTPHAAALPALLLAILAVAPGVSSFSVDAVLLALRARRRGEAVDWRGRLFGPAVSVWPIRAVLILLCLVYFASGHSKLRHAGWQWTDGKTLAFYLGGGSLLGKGERQRFIADPAARAEDSWRDGVGLVDFAYVARPRAFAGVIARSETATRLLALSTLLFELTFPLVLFGRRLLFAFLAAGTLFHIGIILTMRIEFWSYLVVYLGFVDWRALTRRLLGPSPASHPTAP